MIVINLKHGVVESIESDQKVDLDIFAKDLDVLEVDGEIIGGFIQPLTKIIPVVTDGVPFTDADKLIASGLADLEAGLIYKFPERAEVTRALLKRFRTGWDK